MKERTRLHIFGAEMDLVTPDEVFGFIDQSLLAGRACIVANHNLHSLYLYQRDAKMRRFFSEADLIEIDSTPVIAWARLLGLPARRAHRCTYLDFRDDFWRHACERGWRVYHVGGLPNTAPLARAKILESYPNANLVTHHGYFDFDGLENDALLADIAEKKPHILLVGMGMPRQEQWIIANRHKLPVLCCLSAVPLIMRPGSHRHHRVGPVIWGWNGPSVWLMSLNAFMNGISSNLGLLFRI